jgi:hypothetical protein
MRKRIGLTLATLGIVACASLPLKQKAVISLQASEMALEASHDLERSLCSPTADQTQPIRHCDGPQAATLGLTDARHSALAVKFSKAFDLEIQAATALKLWRSGEPAPADFAGYRQVINEILTDVLQFLPKSQPIVEKAQAAVDEAGHVAALLGVK